MALNVNEIRDFLARAPKRFYRSGAYCRNPAAVRYRWLAEISEGSIDHRIERRAGVRSNPDYVKPIQKSIRRNARKNDPWQ